MSEQENDLESFRKQQLTDEIERISKDLNASIAIETATLPERVFENVFLPLFAGDEKLIYDVGFQTWTNYAGGPYRTVNVIDAKGKVLFEVPPLFDRSAINPITESKASIAHVVATASQYAKIHPSQGTHFLDVELSKRALILKVPVNVMSNLIAWNAIFVRYGRPELMALDKSETENKAVEELFSDEFDDL